MSKSSLKRAVAIVLDKEQDEQLALVVAGPKGQDMETLLRSLRLFAPHLQRAVRISHTIASAQLRVAAAEGSLAMDPSAVIALDKDLRIINMNPRGHLLVERGLATTQNGRWLLRAGCTIISDNSAWRHLRTWVIVWFEAVIDGCSSSNLKVAE